MKHRIAILCLVLLLLLFSLPVVFGAELFSDGFEDETFDAWDTTSIDAGCTLEILSADPIEGSFHMHSETDADGSNAWAQANVAGQSQVFTRIYVMINSFPSGNNRDITIHRGSAAVTSLRITNAAPYHFFVRGRDGADWLTDEGSTEITTGVWYCVELETVVDGAAGLHRVYLNGAEECLISGVDTNNYGNIEQIRVGVANCAEVVDVYVDAVVIADSYVGTIPADAYPEYYNPGDDGVTQVGETASFSCNWTDDDELDTCFFSTNNTGTWVNSSLTVSGSSSWANTTKQLNFTQSVVVQYKWYCNDTANQWNTTNTYTLTTTPLYLTWNHNNSTMGSFYVDGVQKANQTQNSYNYNQSIGLQGLPSSSSYIFLSFNWTGSSSTVNPYAFYSSGNDTVWCYFDEAGTGGTTYLTSYIPFTNVGFLVAIVCVVVGLGFVVYMKKGSQT